MRVNAGKRNSAGTSWREVSEMFDCKKVPSLKSWKKPRESSTKYLIDDHIGKYLDISIDNILLIKLINLSGALDSLSTLYDIPNEIGALRGFYRSSPGRRGTFLKKGTSPICD